MTKKKLRQDKKLKKNVDVHFRVADKEKSLIERRAQKCGMSVSEYMRSIVFGQRLKKEIKEEISEMITMCQDLVTYVEERYWCAEDTELEGRINALWKML